MMWQLCLSMLESKTHVQGFPKINMIAYPFWRSVLWKIKKYIYVYQFLDYCRKGVLLTFADKREGGVINY